MELKHIWGICFILSFLFLFAIALSPIFKALLLLTFTIGFVLWIVNMLWLD